MGSTFVIGHKQVSSEELDAKQASGELQKFGAARAANAALDLSSGKVTRGDVTAALEAVPEFTPIGIGKPMSLEILTVYTGDPPGKKRDLLVTSGVRAIETFDAATKMLNQVVPKAPDKQYLQPSAFDQGSPIVYYTSSVTDDTTLCSFQLASDRFDQAVFDSVSGLFSQAAGLPIFLPSKTLLLAGSALTKMIGKLASALFDSGPLLDADLNLRFDTPGLAAAQAHNAVIYRDADFNALKGLDVRPAGGSLALVDPSNGNRYQGVAPYLIVSLDGRKRDSLDKFTGGAVTAAMLSKFYGTKTPTQTLIDTLGSALKLYNDSESRQKGEKLGEALADLSQQIGALDPTSADFEERYEALEKEFDDTKTRYDAWNTKIQEDNFKLPAVSEPVKPSA